MSDRAIEITVIVVYMLLLLGLGHALRRWNKDIKDFFVNGFRGTWWLVGASAYMTAFSAWTFTGMAGVGYEAGWTFLFMFSMGAVSFLLHFLFLAPWFRQLRAITAPQVISMRFNPATQQFYAYINVLSSLLGAAMQLYALAIFCATVFGYEVQVVILAVGLVTIFYSFSGGSWAIMATDVLMGIVLVFMTLLIAVLSLIHIGGLDGLFEAIRQAGLEGQYSLHKPEGSFDAGKYGLLWMAAYAIHSIAGNDSLRAAPKYFGVKDGMEARKAALLAAGLAVLSMLVFAIPPLVARLSFHEEIMQLPLSKPAEGCYAILSLHLLPRGMAGLIVVTMFAATMSSMDSGLNRNVAIIMRDIYPNLCEKFSLREAEGRLLLWGSRLCTLALGLSILACAIYFSLNDDVGVFSIFLRIGALLSVPMAIPMLLCLFFRRVPVWAALASTLAALVPSTLGLLSGSLLDRPWPYQYQIFANVLVGAGVFFLSMLFWKNATGAYREKVDRFFTLMKTPVDFEKEVGESNDLSQLSILGAFLIMLGLFIGLLLLVPNPAWHRLSIVFVGGGILSVGLLMFAVGRRAAARPTKNQGSED